MDPVHRLFFIFSTTKSDRHRMVFPNFTTLPEDEKLVIFSCITRKLKVGDERKKIIIIEETSASQFITREIFITCCCIPGLIGGVYVNLIVMDFLPFIQYVLMYYRSDRRPCRPWISWNPFITCCCISGLEACT